MSEAPDFLPPNPVDLPRGEDCGSGLVVVDKPRGLTSNQVLSRIRRLAGQKKVGYAGTLDPMATGVLIFALGKATKLLQYLSAHDKAYTARVRFGVSTDTDDAEGNIVSTVGAAGLVASRLVDSLGAYRGKIQQVPSTFSAIKVAGKRAYDLARQGQAVKLKSRPVTVTRLELISELTPHETTVKKTDASPNDATHTTCRVPVVDVNMVVECSAGTYIRALARDLGNDLGTGAHLTALRRTRVGSFQINQAKNLQQLSEEVAQNGQIDVIALDDAIKGLFPLLPLKTSLVRSLSFGQSIVLNTLPVALYNGGTARAAALDENERVVALVDVSTELASSSVVGGRLCEGEGFARVKPIWVLRPAQ